LPLVLFSIVALSDFLYHRFSDRIKELFENRKISARNAAFMVLLMGVMVTLIVFSPSQLIQVMFIALYSFMMFIFSYVALKKWYFSIIPPIIFTVFYFLYWNLYTFNFFAALFSVIIIIYLGALFSWKTTLIFTLLLTIMDVIQVFITGFMGESAGKMIELGLPVAIILPAFPANTAIVLGLGDIFLAGLLTIQTGLKEGKNIGVLTALIISIAMFVFEIVSLNTDLFNFFPATIVVVVGWFFSIGIAHLVARN
jgi:hypothetical protein